MNRGKDEQKWAMIVATLASAILCPLLSAQSSEDVAFFRDKVKPILAKHCFECHGGSDGKGGYRIKSGLQLISRKGLLKGGAHGSAINEKEPEKSLLLEVIAYGNDDLQMPPKNKLPDAEIALIAEWVRRGAPWTPEDAELMREIHEPMADVTTVNEKTKAHWSYKPMTRPAVPEHASLTHPLDRFLEAQRQQHGLSANPPASRAELLRRAAMDLTGLTPTHQQIKDFENDSSPDAWRKQIDRLLASPQYGEKWGRHWLDLVRYSESNGFERDNLKPMVWRYRDYVIDSFNQDKPYDRFLIEQLAGDEIPIPTRESIIATGYHRLMQWDDEPADPLQHEYDIIDDNVRVTTETMLGMTVGCARCHDHKGDPIPQKDYFQIASFFRNIKPMSKSDDHLRAIPGEDVGTEVKVRELEREKQTLMEKIATAESDYRKRTEGEVRTGAIKDQPLITDARSGPWKWHYTMEAPEKDWSAVSFRAEEQGWKQGEAGFGTNVPDAKPRTPWNTGEIWLQTTFLLETIPTALVLSLYHDEDIKIFCNGQLVDQREKYLVKYEEQEVSNAFLAALQTGRNVISVHVKQSGGGQFFDMGLTVKGRSLRREMLMADNAQMSAAESEQYRGWDERLQQVKALLVSSQDKAYSVAEKGVTVPPTFIHLRGSAHAEGEEVQPAFPLIFGGEVAQIAPTADGASSGRRLALAKWITRPDNPRTARVMMNRLWQHHFGRGLSATPNDFGFLGIPATHPELLDWMATEFVEKGWSVKAMHRLIMESQAYQMSNRRHETNLAKDPGNEQWWRFLPRRMTSEELRDNILAVTGELNLQMGGPSIYIPIPEEVLATSSTKASKWGTSPPDQVNRRTVYSVSKRSLAVPLLTEHDQADTDSPCPVRFATIVPTQALGMIHSSFIHEKATALAQRLRREAGEDAAAQVRLAYQVALQRDARAEEVERALEFITHMQQQEKLAAHVALQRFCLAVFSFNEFIFID
jgi:mono/diheme cytochrome c family protein